MIGLVEGTLTFNLKDEFYDIGQQKYSLSYIKYNIVILLYLP